LHVVQVTTMSLSEPLARLRELELKGAAAVCVAASMIGALFAGSTLLTPLYVIYKHELGFSQITLTLIYAIYVIGNLAALLLFGRLSDAIGRRRTAVPAMAVAIVSTLIFLFARGALKGPNEFRETAPPPDLHDHGDITRQPSPC
jgi:MFS family permease